MMTAAVGTDLLDNENKASTTQTMDQLWVRRPLADLDNNDASSRTKRMQVIREALKP